MDKFHRFFPGITMGVMTLLLMINTALAQRPTHIPEQSPPVRFFDSVSNIIVFVVIPVLVLVIYLIWKASTTKKKKVKEDRLKE